MARGLCPGKAGGRRREPPGPQCRRWPPRSCAAARMARSRVRAQGRRLRSPPAPRRYCPGRVSAAAQQPRRGRAALRSLPARRSNKGQLGSQARSRLRHDLRRAASRAAASASSGRRRRHVFLPRTWPCRAAGASAPLLPLKASEADELALPGRLRTSLATREPLALLRSGLPYPTASSVFLTEPKPPPS